VYARRTSDLLFIMYDISYCLAVGDPFSSLGVATFVLLKYNNFRQITFSYLYIIYLYDIRVYTGPVHASSSRIITSI